MDRRLGWPTPGASKDRTIDLGQGEAWERLHQTFELGNVGTQPLEFALDATCGCSSLAPRSGVIPPGETRSIAISVRLAHVGSERNVAVTVDTNDGSQPRAQLVARASCPAGFKVTPASVTWTRDIGEATADDGVVVRLRDSAGRAIASVDRVAVTCDEPFVASVVQSADGSLQVVVKATEAAPGTYYGALDLTDPANGRRTIVPLTVTLRAAVAAAPSSLYFAKAGERTVVVWRSDKGRLKGPATIEAPSGIIIEELGDRADHRRRFRVSYDGTPAAVRRQMAQVRFPEDGVTVGVELVLAPELTASTGDM